MKTKHIVQYLFICVIIFSINSSLNAQWTRQQIPDTTFGNYNYFWANSVQFADANTGYVGGGNAQLGGYSGEIHKTNNGGSNWVKLPLTTAYEVWQLEVISPSVVFASSDSAQILKTINGGSSWTQLTTPAVPSNSVIWKMSFINAATGWISTDDVSQSKTFQTTNGGSTWTTVNASSGFSKIKFLSSTNGTGLNKSGFFVTTNSGVNWTNTMADSLLTELYFMNSSAGWLYSKKSVSPSIKGKSWKTTNGGLNWSLLYSNDSNMYAPTGVVFFDDLTGYANYYNSKYFPSGIIKTTNGGVNWFNPTDFRLVLSQTTMLSSFVNQSTGWYSNSNDYLFKTSTGPGNLVNPFFADYYKYQNSNNISSYTSAYAQLTASPGNNSPGFEYPKGSNNFCLFNSSVAITAVVNGDTLLSQSYNINDFRPGIIDGAGNEVGSRHADYGLYQIKTGDGSGVPDWDRWPVSQGAPVSGSQPLLTGNQSTFVTLTDMVRGGSIYETAPLKAEMKIYEYSFNDDLRKDAIYYKINITNKNTAAWNDAYFSFVVDPDIGTITDNDRMGSDSALGLAYGYNGVGFETGYGSTSPAVGYKFISATNGFNLSSCVPFYNPGTAPPACQQDPSGPQQFRNYQKGLDRCGETYTYNGLPGKFVFNGDPQTSTGWLPPFNADARFFMTLGPANIDPGETSTIIIAVLVARGTSYLNSVTKLKQYAATLPLDIQTVSSVIPQQFKLNQNYPNPFNPNTKISYSVPKSSFVEMNVFDITGRLVQTLVAQNLPAGNYEADFNGETLASGIYICRMNSEGYTNSIKMLLVK